MKKLHSPKNNLSLKSILVFSFFIFSFSCTHAQTIMYGMTSAGGSHSDGTIYKFDPSTNTETVVYNFAGGTTDGSSPQYGNLVFDGNNNLFYGMTQSGGANGDGTIFSFNINTNVETLLYSFKGGNTDGASPQDNLTYDPVNGLFYGMTQLGGSSNNAGTIFSFNPNTNAETKLFAFGVNPLIGTPYEGMVYNSTNGLFYGGCWYGGTHNFGGIFSFNPTNNTETTLYNLGSTNDGRYPGLQFTMDPVNGKYYLSGWEGCAHGGGGIMSFDPTTNTEAVVYSVQGGTDGRACTGTLAYYSPTGVFYGVTQGATTQVNGTLYKFDPTTNTHTVIHDFAGSPNDAAEPQAGVIYNYSNGLFYGTTEIGGTNNKGTIYSLNPVTNAVTVVWNFGGTGDGQTPMGSTVQANPNCFLTATGSVLSNVACGGSNTGSATVTASAGQTPYTYLWSDNNSQTTATATGLSAGTYTVFVHDFAGCEAVGYYTITQPNPFTISMASHTNASCAAPGTATAALSSYTYTTTYSYESAVQHFTVPAGVTTITITAAGGQGGGSGGNNDIGGDGASLTGICTVIPGHVISIVVGQKGGYSPGDYGNGGGGGSFVYDSNTNSLLVVAAGGGGAGWQSNGGTAGTNISNNATTTGAGLDGSAAGGTGGNGGSSGGNNVSPGPGPGGAGWLSNGGNSVDDANGDAPYYNGNGGQDRVNHFKGGLACIGDTNYGGYGGGGSGGYDGGGGGGGYNGGGGGKDDDAAYNGNGGGGGGSYLNGTLSGSVTATDTGNGFVTLQYPGPGGVSPYTYSWSPNGGTNIIASDLSAGSYMVTANDANGCTATASVTITGSSLSLSITSNNVLCNGGNTGNATAIVSNGVTPYTYLWSNGATTSSATGLTAGSYTVSVYDNSGCYAADGITITQPTTFVLLATNNAYLPITLTNSQSTATPSNFQEMVTVNSSTYSSYENTGLQNVEFTTGPNGTGSVLQAWIESGATNASTSTVYWVNLGSNTIAASSTLTIYLNFMRTTVMSASGPTGVAPQLYGGSYYATSYGQYDNGASVFPFYDNFKGSSLNPSNNWVNSGITYTVNNGFTATHTGVLGYILSKNLTINPATDIVDFYGSTVQGGDNWMGTGAIAGNNTAATDGYGYGDLIVGGITVGATGGWQRNPSLETNTPTMQTSGAAAVWTITPLSSSSTSFYINYGGVQTVSSGAYTYPLYEGLIAAGANGAAYNISPALSISWYRVRLYAPSNVMPAFALGSVVSAIYVTSNVSCLGGSNGSLSAPSPTGGTTPYTYTWLPNGGNNNTASNLSAGTYTLIINDANGCSTSSITTITQPASGVGITIASYTNATCVGGSAIANAATGGTSPYTYAWAPSGGNGLIATNLAANTYTITATDNTGCSTSASVTITQGIILPNATVTSNVTCFGGNNGSATVNSTGGQSPYTYIWSDASTTTTANISNLYQGVYIVTVTDANDCNATASVSISQPVQFLYVSAGSVSSVTCNGLSNGVATVNSVGGNIPYTYLWSNGSTTVSNVQTPNTLSAGTYTVTVTDNCGVSKTSSTTIVQPNAMRDSVKTQTNISCNGGNGGCITLGCKGGTVPYFYLWSSGSTLVTASSLSAGTYSVVITDQKGCSNTVSNVTIIQPGLLHDSVASISYPICNGGTGIVNIGVRGGTLPYTYIWNPSMSTTATANNLTARSYTVTVKDVHNCTPAVVTFSITQPNAIRDTIVKSLTINASCQGTGASATVGVKYGTPPYTYSWIGNVSTTATATGLGIGTYTVSITDKNGCSGTVASVTISQVSALRDSIVKTATINVSCNGVSNGSATVGIRAGTPPYTYTWNPNISTTATATGLSMGIYTITVMDNAGCSGSAITVSISQPSVLRDSIALISHVGCNGGNGGTASIGTRGGTNPYSYLWSNGKTTYNVTGLISGVYTVSVTDNNGCSNTISGITITQPTAVLTTTIPTPTCLGGGNATVTVNVGGGTPGYSYLWSNGQTNTTMTVVSATYNVRVIDAHGCSTTNSVIVACPEVLHREEIESPAPPCCATIDNIDLYPNPNRGQFTITGLQPGMIVEMYDYTGRKISINSASDITMQLSITNEPNGIYLIRILDKEGILVSQKKVVKTQ